MKAPLNPQSAEALSLILGLPVSAIHFFHDKVWLGEPEEGQFGNWLADQIILAKLFYVAEEGGEAVHLDMAWAELCHCLTPEHEELLDFAQDPNTHFESFLDFLRDRD
jgi:hypothetical protein